MNVVKVLPGLRSRIGRIVPSSSAPLSAATLAMSAATHSSAPPSALSSASSSSSSLSAKQSAKKSPGESGYVLLLVLFMVATLILFAAAATPSILLEGRRAKDQEAIWRGNQYVRAIRLYYRKNGRYPQTLEDLAKPDAVGNHFLRKAYTDPANSGDGTWRVIYVTPSGQLVGSIHYHSLQEMAVARMPGFQLPGATAAPAGAQSAPERARRLPPHPVNNRRVSNSRASHKPASRKPTKRASNRPVSNPGSRSRLNLLSSLRRNRRRPGKLQLQVRIRCRARALSALCSLRPSLHSRPSMAPCSVASPSVSAAK